LSITEMARCSAGTLSIEMCAKMKYNKEALVQSGYADWFLTKSDGKYAAKTCVAIDSEVP